MNRLKHLLWAPMLLLAGCSWWHNHGWFHKQPVPPELTQLVVNGAPAGSTLLIDGSAVGGENPSDDKPQLVDVSPGMHTVEIKVGEKITYRENLYVAPGEKHTVLVLSGNRRVD